MDGEAWPDLGRILLDVKTDFLILYHSILIMILRFVDHVCHDGVRQTGHKSSLTVCILGDVSFDHL